MIPCEKCGMPDPAAYSMTPSAVWEGLQRYIQDHVETGGFLRAVLENDLTEAFGRADSRSMQMLSAIVGWLYNEAPANCWGSRSRVRRWLGEEER